MSANVMGGELWVETMNFGSINNLHSKGATYYVVAKKKDLPSGYTPTPFLGSRFQRIWIWSWGK